MTFIRPEEKAVRLIYGSVQGFSGSITIEARRDESQISQPIKAENDLALSHCPHGFFFFYLHFVKSFLWCTCVTCCCSLKSKCLSLSRDRTTFILTMTVRCGLAKLRWIVPARLLYSSQGPNLPMKNVTTGKGRLPLARCRAQANLRNAIQLHQAVAQRGCSFLLLRIAQKPVASKL